ncbi:hypothetical protein [Anaplasma bovis]|uniref:hypothetical protein n=1 Tax=Anaplasma bovis TaxID=186733 RepID=UPI002FF15937
MNEYSWESYSTQLFKSLDLLKRRTCLSLDYSLRSRREIVHYWEETLQDVCYMVGRARQDSGLLVSRAVYGEIDDTNPVPEDIDTILSRVVDDVQTARYGLLCSTLARSLRVVINRSELHRVNTALRHMYQALEALIPLLYDREEQEKSPIYHTLEDAVSTLATAINVLQVTAARGRGGPPNTPWHGDRTLRNLDPLGHAFIHMAAMSARRAAYIIASCFMFCISPSPDSSTEAEDYYEAMHSYIRSLISIALLVSENVPGDLRSTVSRIAVTRFIAAKRKLSSMTLKMCSHLGIPEELCSGANGKTYEYFPIDGVSFTIFLNVVSVARDACDIFEHATDAYTKYSLGTNDDLTWDVFSPFQCSSIILNLMEAISHVQSISHMLSIVRENVAESFKNKESGFSLSSHVSNAFSLMDISHAIKTTERAMRSLRAAMYIVGYMGGKSAIKRYLECVRERRINGRNITNAQDDYLCFRMLEVSKHIRYACFELYDFVDLRVSLELSTGTAIHGMYGVAMDMHRTFLSCARIFDAMFYEGFHEYVWNGRFESSRMVFPGELPEKVPSFSILYRMPEVLFSYEVLNEALNVDAVYRPITKNAGELRSIYEYGKRKQCLPSSGVSFSTSDVVQCTKEWLCSSCPSSLLSAVSITRTFLQNVGTLMTDAYTFFYGEGRGIGNL